MNGSRRYPSLRVALSLAWAFSLGTPTGCGSYPSEEITDSGGDGLTAEEQVASAVLPQSFTQENGYWVSRPLQAPEGATRVGAMIDVAPGFDAFLLRFEARGIAEDGRPGDWIALEVLWSEGALAVVSGDLDHYAAAAQLRIPNRSAQAFTQMTWSAVLPVERPVAEDMPFVALETATAALVTGVEPRSAWNARAPTCAVMEYTKDRMTIHHTVTDHTHPDGYAARLRQIQNFHMDVRGWCDIAYNYLVTTDGTVWEGRGQRRGGHTAGENTKNIGISLIGCFHPTSACTSYDLGPISPPGAMWDAAGVVTHTLANHWSIPINTSTLVGHRDLGSTACPGDNVYDRLDELRDMAQNGVVPTGCNPVAASGGVISESGPCFRKYGPAAYWRTVTGAGQGGSLLWTNAWQSATPSNWARWYIEVPQAGEYSVELRLDASWAIYAATPYRVSTATGDVDIIFDQSAGEGWRSLGDFDFDVGGGHHLSVFDNTTGTVASDQHIMVDAIRVTPVPVCGDGLCAASEGCAHCPADCGACPPVCGDGLCNGNETCSDCTGDCGACPVLCGDGACDVTEGCGDCPDDCGGCPPSCGDSVCDGGESCSDCPGDCGACGASCDDGTCNGGENCATCPADCGACPPLCGDGVCNSDESCASCAVDCGVCSDCGDGICDTYENCLSCTADCVCAEDQTGVAPAGGCAAAPPVTGGGLLAVAGLWLLRRRRSRRGEIGHPRAVRQAKPGRGGSHESMN